MLKARIADRTHSGPPSGHCEDSVRTEPGGVQDTRSVQSRLAGAWHDDGAGRRSPRRPPASRDAGDTRHHDDVADAVADFRGELGERFVRWLRLSSAFGSAP